MITSFAPPARMSGRRFAYSGHAHSARRRAPALASAVETMMRGAAFLYGRAGVLDADGVSSDGHRATVLGNSLRELDRFFNILLDELAAASGLRGHALRVFRRRRSANAKLAAYPGLFGHRVDDRARLLALSSQQAALLGRSLKSGFRLNAMLIAGPPAKRTPPVDLREVSAYYGRLAARIIRHVEHPRAARPTRRPQSLPVAPFRPAIVVTK
ncbi:MAG: hypothetical protein EOP61_11835 [Sphingomonadales bacterium]|nr:MAG: hypothetical protein EOP61_11835 [Sphingomonadales bacterium]